MVDFLLQVAAVTELAFELLEVPHPSLVALAFPVESIPVAVAWESFDTEAE
jgi:hypothetical protein